MRRNNAQDGSDKDKSLRGGISIVFGMMLTLCWSSLGHADDQPYGSLDFSRMTKEQEQFFWNRLDLLAFEEAILTYCGQPDDFATKARQGIKACVTEDSLHKAESFFKGKLSASIGRLGAQKFSCKSKAVGASMHGWLGVEVQPLSAAAAGAKAGAGVLVAKAMAGSPAEAAGVKSGDVITSVNGADVADPKELVRRVAQNAPQATAAIGILRDGAAQTINVKLGSVAMDAQGHVAADGPVLINSSKADLDFVATETAGMCQRCKNSIWAVFCR
jgi:PDZ domain